MHSFEEFPLHVQRLMNFTESERKQYALMFVTYIYTWCWPDSPKAPIVRRHDSPTVQ
jgi:hypothetical protein